MFQTPSKPLIFFLFFIASQILLAKSPGLWTRISEGQREVQIFPKRQFHILNSLQCSVLYIWAYKVLIKLQVMGRFTHFQPPKLECKGEDSDPFKRSHHTKDPIVAFCTKSTVAALIASHIGTWELHLRPHKKYIQSEANENKIECKLQLKINVFKEVTEYFFYLKLKCTWSRQ